MLRRSERMLDRRLLLLPLWIGLAGSAAMTLPACVADGPQPPQRPTPRDIRPAPGVQPAIVQLNASPSAIDSNNNGFADTITVTAYLFPAPPAPPVPMESTGTFLFILEDDQNEQLATWEIDPESARSARRRFAPGIGYHFELNINDVASDEIMRTWGNLSAFYTLPDGTVLPERGNVTIQIGPTRTRQR